MLKFSCVLLILLSMSATAFAGKIVLANDEWTLSNSGYSGVNDPDRFAKNVAGWFTGGGSGSFLAYSTNFGLTGSNLASTMTSAGHGWTVSTAVSFDLPTLLTYDGVFLAGNAAPNSVLIDYVNAGGNVYLAAGTGWGGAVAEAAQWNTFLNSFGLGYGSVYNGVGGNIAISSPHAIFAGVDHLYQNNGNDTLDLLVADPHSQLLVSSGGHGLYAVYDSSAGAPVPEPFSMVLMATGMLSLLGVKRRRS